MEVLTNLINKLKSLDFEVLARQVIEENRPLLEDMNAEQLESGLTAFGKEISPGYRSDEYALGKNYLNPKPGLGTPDLNDTGAFWKSINIKTTRNELAFEATDPKAPELEAKYGAGILGLSEENKTEFIQAYLREEMQDKIRKHFGL